MALAIISLYLWSLLAGSATAAALIVSLEVTLIATLAGVISAVTYIWASTRLMFWQTLAAYIILCVATIGLIVSTGGTMSPFIALWMIIAVFAGVFAWYGLAPLFLAVTGYGILLYIDGALSQSAIVTILLAGHLPLAVSYLIWHSKAAGTNSSDKAYKRLATELSQVANKSEVVINAIADGVIALNSQGVIQLINPAAQQIIGWGKQDALALDYKSVLRILDKDGKEVGTANDPVHEVLATNKQVDSSAFYLLTNSEKKIAVSISISPVGQLGAGVIIVFRDITSEKVEERQQAEFISTASHEMRTPVASIEGYLGLALNPATAQIDEKAREYINKAHESAQHLGRLFSDLLDISKAEDGRLSSNPKVVDVVSFAHDIVQGLRPQADAKGLRLFFKPIPDDDERGASSRHLSPVFYANVDHDHLREVLSNLVENAIKYTLRGDVTVDVTGDGEHVVISVADSGIGIPKEDQAHLFQKFYRVDNTDTREIGGTGLGLYLSRRLAEAMGGRIWVESEYKRGSTFFVEIARTSHEDAMRIIESAESATEPSIGQSQVLLPTADTSSAFAAVEQGGQQATYSTTQQPAAPPPSQPQPATTPYQQQTPAPPASPIPAAGRTQPPLPVRQQPNTPLTNIEQNPSQYTRTRPDSSTIPPRSQ